MNDVSDLPTVPLIVRGTIIEGDEKEYGGRSAGLTFRGPDVSRHLDKLTLKSPLQMADLYALSFEEIVSFLAEFGSRLDYRTNPHLQRSFEMCLKTSRLSESLLRYQYSHVPHFFEPEELRNVVRRSVGIDHLEGWVQMPPGAMPGLLGRTRAFGARTVHVIAGNTPLVSVITVIRNALIRSDAIIKMPSNDPVTATALARTMIDMAPDHPITKHLTVAYWKGGDEAVENHLYDPRRIEKIVAWGGFAGIQHITKYLQPGIDLITHDPKLSATIIGPEAFADEATLQSVARRLALDVGAGNQEACVSARVVYVASGLDEEGLERANRLGELTFQALQGLPENISTPHKSFDPELKDEIDGLRFMDEDYRLFGGRSNEGAIIVSQDDSPVDFSRILACRVGNVVPVEDVATAIQSISAYTQTIGVYPERLKSALRDQMAFAGAQRIVSLGGAATMQHSMERQDGIETVRRMCKWVVEETCDGAVLDQMAG